MQRHILFQHAFIHHRPFHGEMTNACDRQRDRRSSTYRTSSLSTSATQRWPPVCSPQQHLSSEGRTYPQIITSAARLQLRRCQALVPVAVHLHQDHPVRPHLVHRAPVPRCLHRNLPLPSMVRPHVNLNIVVQGLIPPTSWTMARPGCNSQGDQQTRLGMVL